MRPAPSTMSDCHLLDEYLTVYRDGGRRHAEIRAQLESRLAACDALRAEVERLRAELRLALRLLGEAWSEGAGDAAWSRETFALLAKHKETP